MSNCFLSRFGQEIVYHLGIQTWPSLSDLRKLSDDVTLTAWNLKSILGRCDRHMCEDILHCFWFHQVNGVLCVQVFIMLCHIEMHGMHKGINPKAMSSNGREILKILRNVYIYPFQRCPLQCVILFDLCIWYLTAFTFHSL